MRAADPPPDLARRVAHRESETAEERRHYAYTQSVRLQELDGHGIQAGEYREVRDVIFSPTGDRTERFPSEPVSRLKNLVMTPEDFADLRDIQPFVMTEDQLFIYEVQYKGEEEIDGQDCWVLSRSGRVRSFPANVCSMACSGSGEDDFSVIRSEGKAVPEIVTMKQENLFPHFTTVRRQVNGFWFPAITSADDTLYFRSGADTRKTGDPLQRLQEVRLGYHDHGSRSDKMPGDQSAGYWRPVDLLPHSRRLTFGRSPPGRRAARWQWPGSQAPRPPRT